MTSPRGIQTADGLLERAVSVLLEGGLVAFPTDTLYALGAHGFTPAAVERVFQAKDRPSDMALPLLLAGVEDLEKVAVDVPPQAWDFAERFWPGGLTMILRKAPSVPYEVTAGGETVAVRVPNHSVARELISAVGVPLTGTSANRSGEAEPVTADEVRRQMAGRVDMVLDDGPCQLSGASTIIDVTGDSLRIVREGVVSPELLTRIWPGEAGAMQTDRA
ncbi:MAG: L-threonylcarbamoyladenylate synthase [Chloroflexota bacterium]|nr:L-threonylcarbamoyladenylate synthase [Chloroflexota bacterium]MDE2940887.1 L-threonylcarbamoyladenylate synthase [Chloroflexota bacterium]MDE3268412.1 L-threonylcarbamoyladenylate synthase [Chloroflexota bacterium]